MTKENAAVGTKKHKETTESKKESTRIKEDEDQSLVSTPSTITSSPDDGKPQTTKEEEDRSKEEQEITAEEKNVDEKMAVDSSIKTSADTQGLKLTYFLGLKFSVALTDYHHFEHGQDGFS